jgi:hypothetical protein
VILAMAGQMSPAAAEEAFWREKPYPDSSYRGPEQALGALLFNHGRGVVINGRIVPGDSYNVSPPGFVHFLHDSGWDAFKLNRRYAADNESSSLAALREQVAALRAEGYKRIVLAGQSYGAWLSVLIATREPGLHAVIATAPGSGFGAESSDAVTKGAQKLVDAAGAVKPTRLALFLFEGDYRDADWVKRGERVKQALNERAIANLVVDHPRGFQGHGSAHSGRFTRRYGECLVRFIAPEPIATPFACDLDHGLAAGSDIVLPEKMPLPSMPADLPRSLANYVGRWYGDSDNGAARLFVTTGVLPDGRLRFDYGAVGGLYSHDKPLVIRAMIPQFEGDALVWRDKSSERRFEYRPDGTLHASWGRIDGKPGGSGESDMRRLPD